MYYDVPELRFLVDTPGKVPDSMETETSDPTIDPDYTSWGKQPATVNYTGLIPYLIKGFQEMSEKITTLEKEIQRLNGTRV